MVGTLVFVTTNTIETLMGLKGWMSVLNVSISPVPVYIVYPKKEKVSSSLWRDDSDMNRGNRNIWDRHPSVLFHQYFYRIRGHKNVSNHHF